MDKDEPVVIELDDPPPRGAGIIATLVVLTVVAIIAAPFLINAGTEPSSSPARSEAPTTNRQMCQPQLDVPVLFEPLTNISLPGFMRLCDWLAPLPAPPASRLSPPAGNVLQPVHDRGVVRQS